MNWKNLFAFLLLLLLMFLLGCLAPQDKKPVEIMLNNEKIVVYPDVNREILEAKCRENNQFFSSAWDCWEESDSIYCGKITRNSGCCNLKNQCFEGKKCFESNSLYPQAEYVLCFKGKWDWCNPIDKCKKRSSYWCNGEKWALQKPLDCEDMPVSEEKNVFENTRKKCPLGQFLRGEWDCWQKSDHKNCGSSEFERGCCAKNECFFAGECQSNDAPLSKASEWFCFKGKWDRCLLNDECLKRGSYYCSKGFWVNEKPQNCN